MNRRYFLQGLTAGTGVAAAFFNSPVARGQTSTAPVRVLFIPIQHGWGHDRGYQTFTGTEYDFTIPSPLSALTAIRDQCVFVDGVRGTLWGNAHDVSYSDILTASVCWEEHSSAQIGAVFPEPMGPSIDYAIAKHHQRAALRVSAGYRSWGLQSHPLSFDENARWLPSFTTPRATYDSIIAPLREAAQPIPPGRKAVRDQFFSFLGRDTDRMLAKVSGTERLKLESYLDALNGLGNRLTSRAPVELLPSDIPNRPGTDLGFVSDVDHYLDLITLAFRADTHRVAVLGLGEGMPNWNYTNEDGQADTGSVQDPDFHHNVAHYEPSGHGGSLDPRQSYEGWIDAYVRKIVAFAQKLDTIEDVDGNTLLDNTIMVLTGEVANGMHDTRQKLHVLIGGGGGIRRGRWIRIPGIPARARGGFFIGGQTRDGTRVESNLNYGSDFAAAHTGDLLAAVGRLAGVPMETFGFATNNTYRLDLL